MAMLAIPRRVGTLGEMDDAHWMALALEEARKGIGRTAPNPPVGAVIVKDGILLGKGWHRAAGQPHAEREAIADARRRFGDEALKGSTIYVTLEPCSTQGRTPPCTAGLMEAGVARVVYAATDQNPAHAGRADTLLRSAGIEVVSSVLESSANELLRPFFKVQKTGLPWVIWKTAMSLDGRLTRPDGEGQWLSGPGSRRDVQRLRSEVDAILTSGETARRDLPQLTIREPGLIEGRDQPWRVVLTSNPDSLPVSSPLFSDEWKHRTLVRSGSDLESVLRSLVRENGVLSVLLESGGSLAAAFFEAKLIDEVVVYLAPLLCGGPTPATAGHGFEATLDPKTLEFTRIDEDVRLRGLIR
jgi:diaminohydroxyphosphoribosylaminopyrimidine deaminase/5-amino-6-(5-phosphoribosylamino)uracil reductase